MDIKSMHYDFKSKLNKIDSQQYRNLLVPEIDWKLNEAIYVIIDIIAKNRTPSMYKGFEHTLKNTDDIRTIVVTDYSPTIIDNNDSTFTVQIPKDYLYFENSTVELDGRCGKRKGRIFIERHEEDFLNSPFNSPSYIWGEVPAILNEDGLLLYTDGTFTISDVKLSYIRKPALVHNAEDFVNGTYKLPNGVVLTGKQDCDLPEQLHREVVDLAVYITSTNIQTQDIQAKLAKLSLNNVIEQ